MKRLAVLLFIPLFACSPQTRINKIYTKHPDLKPESKTETIIQEREIVKYRDTTVYVNIERTDTIYKTTKVYIERGGMVSDTVRASSDYADAWAWVNINRLHVGISDKDTTLRFRLENALMEASKWKYESSKETKVVMERYVPKFIKVTSILGIILTLSIICYILWRFRTKIRRDLKYLFDLLG
jgi:hypothetical protein